MPAVLSFFKSAPARASKPADDENAEPASVQVTQGSAPVESGRLSTSTATVSGSANSPPTVCVFSCEEETSQTITDPKSIPLPDSPNPAASLTPLAFTHGPDAASVVHSEPLGLSKMEQPYSTPGNKDHGRFSFLSLPFFRSDTKLVEQPRRKSSTRSLPTVSSGVRFTGKKSRASRSFTVYSLRTASTEKRAKESAVIIRSIIVGDHNVPSDAKPVKAKAFSRSAVARVKSQLLKPKAATKVVAQLKALSPQPTDLPTGPNAPIRAVCLDVTDDEAYERYFSKLGPVVFASIEVLATTLANIHIVDLLMAPNMGFGASADAPGLFAGAVPTAEIILEGLQQITPQLLALGYATGKAVLPDHKGVTVPTDRISVLTYWWGFEICLPPATIAHIQAAASPGSALLDLLTAIAVLNDGVREVLPFIRYFAQFVQMEWHLIRAADEGKGVVCFATWLMPAALVPRPWDFQDPSPQSEARSTTAQPLPVAANPITPTTRLSTTVATPKASTDGVPRVSSAFSEITCDDDEIRPVISSEPPVLPELVVSSPTSIEEESEPVDGDVYTISDEVQRESEAIVL